MKLALALAAAALLAGCPGNTPEDASQASPPKTTTTTVSPRTPVTTTNIAAPALPVVDVQLLEYQIRMPDTLTAGRQQFRIADAGHEQHGFAIEGPGLSTQLGSNLTRGDKTDLTVTLQPGTYTVWCPVDGHRGKGMQRTITVH
jgi:hypothetical protein